MADFEWYRSFVAVYQEGTVSAAAQRRTLTQPAVSGHILALEKLFDIQLFLRTPRRMIPTEMGQALYTQIIGAVEQLESATHSGLQPQNASREVRLGTPREYFYVDGLARLAVQDAKKYRVTLIMGQTARLLRQLEDQELDAVIATQKVNRRNFAYFPFFTERFVLVGSPQRLIPTTPTLSEWTRLLEDQPWLAYGPDLPIIRRYWQEVFGRRPMFTPTFIVPDLLMLRSAIELDLGISILPDYLCQDEINSGRIKVLYNPESQPSNTLYLVLRREYLHTEAGEWLESMFRFSGLS